MEKRENKFAEIVLACVDEKYFKAEAVAEYHALIRIISGEMKIVLADHSYVFTAGDVLLVPRNQLCTVIKRPKDGRPYKSIAVAFKTERLKEYYSRNDLKISQAFAQKLRTYPPHPLLDSYFASMLPYFELKSELPEAITSLKIEEGINILRSVDPNVDSLLADFSEPGKINLTEFMEQNFMFNMPLEKFSYLTGRSIATFNRDFRKAYPRVWRTELKVMY